jgi:ATP-dependent protease ClpP protease subunit
MGEKEIVESPLEANHDVMLLEQMLASGGDQGSGPYDMQQSKGVEVDENRIHFYAPVSDKDVLELNKILRSLDVEMQCLALRLKIPSIPIELHIHSPGGDLFSGLAAVDVIKSIKSPTHSYVEGSAASAATLMSVVADKRTMYKNSYMLIHQISTLMLHGKFEEFKDEMENQTNIMNLIKNIYFEHTKLTEEKIDELLKHDLWLDAETCLEYGLVDEIL